MLKLENSCFAELTYFHVFQLPAPPNPPPQQAPPGGPIHPQAAGQTHAPPPPYAPTAPPPGAPGAPPPPGPGLGFDTFAGKYKRYHMK